MIKTYYELTKPGLVWGNVITTLAGFLFASKLLVVWPLLGATLLGAVFVIASACVFNNIFDREADKKMVRTKKRALVSGSISVRGAAIFGAVLGLLGFALLFLYVSVLSGGIAFVGFAVYVGLYTPLKYRSPWTVFVGSIAGACPIAIGYTAALGRLDIAGALLFLTMIFWQMPHFYAISLMRRSDYAAAGVPVLSIAKGNRHAYAQIVLFIVLYIIAVMSLTFFGYTGITFLAILVSLSGVWLGCALAGLRHPDDTSAARRIFFMSIAVMITFSILISFASLLP